MFVCVRSAVQTYFDAFYRIIHIYTADNFVTVVNNFIYIWLEYVCVSVCVGEIKVDILQIRRGKGLCSVFFFEGGGNGKLCRT